MRTEPDQGGEGRLDHAVAHRAEVHQATGMVSIQLDISAPPAPARMRAHAFAHDRLLVDVARDVVTRRLTFAEASPRWSTFVAAVAERGDFRSVHALPLRLRGRGRSAH